MEYYKVTIIPAITSVNKTVTDIDNDNKIINVKINNNNK